MRRLGLNQRPVVFWFALDRQIRSKHSSSLQRHKVYMLGAEYVVALLVHRYPQATSALRFGWMPCFQRKKPDGTMAGQTQKGQLPNESVFGLFKCSARSARLFWCNRTFKRLHNGSSNTIRWFSWNQITAMDSSAKNKPVIFQCRVYSSNKDALDSA